MDQILPGTGVDPAGFWAGLEQIIADLGPQNQLLLEKRDQLQEAIDRWHVEHRNSGDYSSYKQHLKDIGYLIPEGEAFKVTTENVDDEVARIAGPQLVVPVDNARYALSAANARWTSLYDALYGTDVIPEVDGCKKTAKYNPVRGARVIEYARNFLDMAAPLAIGSHSYAVKDE